MTGFSVEQIRKMRHMLGLTPPIKKPVAYRNYYNSGRERDNDLEELVNQKLMVVYNRGTSMGGFYYHLTNDGVGVCQMIFGPFEFKDD